MVRSAVNSIDFRLREANFGGFPKGIVYNIQALGSWLYDKNPFTHLRFEKVMRKIKKRMHEGYFEDLIRRYLIENNHRSILVAVPKPGLGKKLEARERKILKTVKGKLSADAIDNLIAETKKLQELQLTPDSPEALAALPSLEIQDVPKEIEKYPLEIKNQGDSKILFHDLFTNDIAYIQIGFNTHSVPDEMIPYISLL